MTESHSAWEAYLHRLVGNANAGSLDYRRKTAVFAVQLRGHYVDPVLLYAEGRATCEDCGLTASVPEAPDGETGIGAAGDEDCPGGRPHIELPSFGWLQRHVHGKTFSRTSPWKGKLE